MVKIWQAYGPNLAVCNQMGASPYYGVFRGEREDVIDWVDAEHPNFRNHIEGHLTPKAELREITPKEVTKEMTQKLRLVLKQKEETERALENCYLVDLNRPQHSVGGFFFIF